MENIFDAKTAQAYINRINNLTLSSERKWGSMTVSQMLAHLNVAYELVYEPSKHKEPGFLARWILKSFVKNKVVSDKPFSPNLPTSPSFIIKEEPDFEKERKRLIGFIQKTQQLGAYAFEGKKSSSFGTLTAQEWNNMFVKHLNHHLAQFSN